MRTIKLPEQMGMLMSASSASLLTRDVIWKKGLETELEVVERLSSYQTDGKTPPYQGWRVAIERPLITDCWCEAGAGWVTKYFLRFWAGHYRRWLLFLSERGGAAMVTFSFGRDPAILTPTFVTLRLDGSWFAQPRTMLWDSLGIHLERGCLLNSCFSCKQCKHTQTTKLATKLVAEQS